MRSANRRLTAWSYRYPWRWGIVYGMLTGTSTALLRILAPPHQGFGEGVSVGLAVGLFAGVVQGVVTRGRAVGHWTPDRQPGPVLRSCQVSLISLGAVVVGLLLAMAFLSPARSLGGALIAILIVVALVTAVTWRLRST
jgi:hypothetical protein